MTKIPNKNKCFDTIIIGGGISGLYYLHKNNQKINNENVLLLEKKPYPGGRIKTRTSNNKVLYETRAWRIHHSHKRVLNLIEEIGLKDNLKKIENKLQISKNCSSEKHPEKIPGLSHFDTLLLKDNFQDAQNSELSSGYYEEFRGSSLNNVYDVLQKNDPSEYYVLMNGLTSIVNKLYDDNKKNIELGSFVNDVKYENNLYKICLRNKENEHIIYSSKKLILALPPYFVQHFDVAKCLRPEISRVSYVPLNHIYVRDPNFQDHRDAHTHTITCDEFGQKIHSTFNNNWHQYSYTSGDLARFWNRLRMTVDKETYFKKLNLDPKKFSYEDVDNCYTEIGSYQWNALWGEKNITQQMKEMVYPNKKQLPNLFWVGEAFSTYQGWIEGALETVDELEKIMSRNDNNDNNDNNSKELLKILGRVVDVSDWKHSHPGGKEIIEKYFTNSEKIPDATNDFLKAHNADYVFGILKNLEI